MSQSPQCPPEPCSAGWGCLLPCCSSCSLLLLGDTFGASRPSCRAPGAFPECLKCQGGSNRLAQGIQEGWRVNCEKVALKLTSAPWGGPAAAASPQSHVRPTGASTHPQPSVPKGGPWRDPRDDLGAGAEPACTNLCLPLTCVLARSD